MSERKVLNKYFPPDFDPSKVPRMRKPKDRQEVIRLMAPFSMRCNTCGEYIYAGKKFNGRKETVQGETYYGIKIFRFYLKCPVCSSEITFKTDPKNSDYAVEHGVSRNFEPWREGKKDDAEADPLAHLIEEEGLQESDDEDPMKALEKRTQEAKREMEIMDALQDIRTRNARIDRVDTSTVLQNHMEKGKDKAVSLQQMLEEEEDEALVRKYFGKDLATAPALPASGTSTALPPPPLVRSGSVLTSGSDPHSLPDAATADSRGKPSPPSSTTTNGLSVKRVRPDEEHEKEPEIASLLSEKANEQLQAAKSTAASTWNSSRGVSTATGGSKRKKGSSAFGIVRKKT